MLFRSAIFDVGSDGMKAALYGLIIGVAAAALMLRVLRSQLWGIHYYDTLTLVIVMATVLTIAALASLVPALRLAHLDPSETFRTE